MVPVGEGPEWKYVLLPPKSIYATMYVAMAVREWIAAVGAKTAYIERGSPWENGYCESFNSKLRANCSTVKSFTLCKRPR